MKYILTMSNISLYPYRPEAIDDALRCVGCSQRFTVMLPVIMSISNIIMWPLTICFKLQPMAFADFGRRVL